MELIRQLREMSLTIFPMTWEHHFMETMIMLEYPKKNRKE